MTGAAGHTPVTADTADTLGTPVTADTPGTSGPAAGPGPEPIAEEELPGDPVCLLRRVCPACGAVADADPPTTCPQCHRHIPAA